MLHLVTSHWSFEPHLSRATRILVAGSSHRSSWSQRGPCRHVVVTGHNFDVATRPATRHVNATLSTAESGALVCLRKIAGLLTCRRRRQRRRILSRCYGVGVAVVGNVWVWAAAEAAESLTVPLAGGACP